MHKNHHYFFIFTWKMCRQVDKLWPDFVLHHSLWLNLFLTVIVGDWYECINIFSNSFPLICNMEAGQWSDNVQRDLLQKSTWKYKSEGVTSGNSVLTISCYCFKAHLWHQIDTHFLWNACRKGCVSINSSFSMTQKTCCNNILQILINQYKAQVIIVAKLSKCIQ